MWNKKKRERLCNWHVLRLTIWYGGWDRVTSAEIAAADSPHHVSAITMGTNKAVPGLFPDQTLQLLQEWQSHTIQSVKKRTKDDERKSKGFELNHLDILTSSRDDLYMQFKPCYESWRDLLTCSLWKSGLQLFDIYRQTLNIDVYVSILIQCVSSTWPQRVLKAIWETSNKLGHTPTCFPRKRLSTCRLLRSQSTTRPLL